MPLVPVTGLEDEGRDRLRALEHDDLLELAPAPASAVSASALDAVIRMRHVDDAGHAGLRRPAARIAGQRQAPAVPP